MNFKTLKVLILDKRFQLFIIALITFLVYANSLSNKLVWDDHLLLQRWNDIKSFNHIPEILMGSAPETFGKIYRPLRGLAYVFDYALWKDNPFFYRLQAILVHVFITIIVYLILEKLFKNKYLIFFVALIFGVHTIHTEQIDYIAASMDSFGILFFFLSFYFYILGKKEKRVFSKYNMGAIIFLSLSVFTYELTVTLPAFFVLYDLYFDKDNFMETIENKKLLKKYFPYFLPLLTFLFLRTTILHLIARTDYLGYNFFLTMLVMIKVFAQYVGLLFFPVNLTANHLLVGDFPVTMLPYDKLDPVLNQKIYDLNTIVSAGILIFLFVLIPLLYKKLPAVSFGIAWFFLSLVPVSYVIPSGGAMAERYLYIASFGFLVAVCYPLFKLAGTAKGPKNFVAFLLIIVTLLYSFATFERNKVWKDDISLFTDMEQKTPGNLKALYSLGTWYEQRGDYSNSSRYYQKAIDKVPEFWEARFNLGKNYLKLGKNSLALSEFSKVLEYNPSFYPAIEAVKSLNPRAFLPAALKEKGANNYKFPLGFSLKYPSDLDFVNTPSGIILSDKNTRFSIILSEKKLPQGVLVNDYIKNQDKSYGILVNQGLARIPNVDYAYVKVWNLSNSVQMMQFFFFSGNKILEARVSPSNSPLMKIFDQIVSSIKII